MTSDDAMVVATEALTKIDGHITECARNYDRVDTRLGRIEKAIIATLVTALVFVAGQAWLMYNVLHPVTVSVPVTIQQPAAHK